jgi:hypothetical protein
MWAKMSLKELIESSSLVVIGELVSTERLPNNSHFDSGKIRITKVVIGDKTLQEVFIAMPNAHGAIKSTDINYKQGQSGVWFLRPDNAKKNTAAKDLYFADNPQRFQSVDILDQLEQALR